MSVPSVSLDVLCVDGYRELETVWFDLRDYLTITPETWVNLAWLKRQGGFIYPLEISGGLRWEFHFRLKPFRGWAVLSARIFHQGASVSGTGLSQMEQSLVEKLFDAQEVGYVEWAALRRRRSLFFRRTLEHFVTRARVMDWYVIRTLEQQHGGGLEAPTGPLPQVADVLEAIASLLRVFDADETLEFDSAQWEKIFFNQGTRIIESLGEEEAHALHQLLKG